MQAYAHAAERAERELERFRGVNKTIVQSVLASAGAFFGSLLGLGLISIFLAPGQMALLRVGFWDAFLAAGIGLAIAVVQSWHLGRLTVAARDLARATALAAIGGFLAGASLIAVKWGVTLLLGWLLGRSNVPHVLGWTAEGLVIGLFISRAVPNLSLKSSALAGTAAGLAGGAITAFGVWVALADALKGLFLGASIGVAERLARKAWIVVQRQPSTAAANASSSLVLLDSPPELLLGEQPILIGSTPACQVFVPRAGEAPKILASLELREGRISYEDRVESTRRELRNGEHLSFNEIAIEIHTEPEKAAGADDRRP